jgi:excinuclease ABC subunit A
VKYHGNSINDLLNMSIGQARDLMSEIPKIHGMLQVLCEVGLDYLALGQSAPTLSGGEAQRVKLAAELCRPATGRSLYLLDEPTTGLHFDDINKLMIVLDRLVASGNTVVIIEHNLEVIRIADWIIDLGPEAGHSGGQVVFAGPPSELVRYAKSSTHSSGSTSQRKSRGSKQLVVHEAHSDFDSKRIRSHTGEALLQWEERSAATPTKPTPKPAAQRTAKRTTKRVSKG